MFLGDIGIWVSFLKYICLLNGFVHIIKASTSLPASKNQRLTHNNTR